MSDICEWRDCMVFPDCYAVSSNGDVLSKRSGKLLKLKLSKAGYYYVALACHGEIKTMRIHRLVALAFIPNPENKPTVNHINEIKTDNRVENLEWATIAEQNAHGTRLKRARAHTDYHARKIDYSVVAAKHDYVKLAKINSHPVKVWDVSGEEPIYMGEFPSQKAASEFTGVSSGKVSQCVSGQKKSCKGYVFEEFPIAVTKIRFPEEQEQK